MIKKGGVPGKSGTEEQMDKKIINIRREIRDTERKIRELKSRLAELKAKETQMVNDAIVKAVRGMDPKLDPMVTIKHMQEMLERSIEEGVKEENNEDENRMAEA